MATKAKAKARDAITLYLSPEDREGLDLVVEKSVDGLKKNSIYLNLLRKGIQETNRKRTAAQTQGTK